MKNLTKPLLALFFLCVFSSVFAEKVTETKALQVATTVNENLNLSDEKSADLKSKESQSELILAFTKKINVNQNGNLKSESITVAYYVFNRGNDNGFIIISGDDRAKPVLGYSTEGEFDAESMPPNMEAWMTGYEESIAYACENNIEADGATSEAWEQLLLKSTEINSTPSQVLLPTVDWGQDAPYNNLCPEVEGETCLTGCVATAMGIVMKYNEWPETGTGSHSYTSSTNSLSLSADFNTSYDWDNMLDSYDDEAEEQTAAVAKLLYHCGVAVDMDYDVSSSGAYTIDVETVLQDYFGYASTVEYLSKSSYSETEWEELLKKELENNRPLIYNGYNESEGGHTFVCDGYYEELFHFNWGWDGTDNGYYALNALASDYINDQGMIRGITKSGGTTYYRITYIETDGVEVIPEDGYDMDKITPGNDFKFTITRSSGYKMFDLTIKANDEIISPVNGIYTISDINSVVTITAELSGGFAKKVLLEVFARDDCSATPSGVKNVKTVVESRSDVICAEHHAFMSFPDILNLEKSECYTDFYDYMTGWFTPAIMYDRNCIEEVDSFPTYGIESNTSISEIVDGLVSELAIVSIRLSGTYDNGSNTVQLGVSGKSLSDFADKDMRLTIFITENNLTGESGTTYFHTVRDVVTYKWGDDLSFSQKSYGNTYTITLDPSWNVNNLKIIAFISEYDRVNMTLRKIYNAEWTDVATSFDTDSNEGKYTVLTKAEPDSMNNIVSGGGVFSKDSVVTVVAYNSPSYTFKGWYTEASTCVSANKEYSFKNTDNKTLIAKFEEKEFTVKAGSLEELFTEDEWEQIYSLKLLGTMDARDFSFLHDQLQLRKLNLKGIDIQAYEESEANMIPENALSPLSSDYKEYIDLITVYLPESTTTIGYGAFSMCFDLTNVYWPDGVRRIYQNSFCSTNLSGELTLPANLEDLQDGAFQDVYKFTKFIISKNNNFYSVSDGILFNKDTTCLVLYPWDLAGNSFIFPESVTAMRPWVFEYGSYCVRKKNHFIVDASLSQLKEIPWYTFVLKELIFSNAYGSMFQKIRLPSSLDSVVYNAFYYSTIDTIECMAINPPKLSAGYSQSLPSSFEEAPVDACLLIVPPGSKTAYQVADGWKDFLNIKETEGFVVSVDSVFIGASANSTAQTALNSNISWTVSSNQSWLTVSPLSGTGNDTLTYTAEANAEITEQTAVVTVSAEGFEDKTIVVVQEAAAYFEVSVDSVFIGASANSTAQTALNSNISWTVNSNQSWLTVSPLSGTGNDTLTYTAEANAETTERTAVVTVSAEGFEDKTIVVVQEAAAYFEVSVDSVFIGASANSTAQTALNSNVSWAVSSNQSWLTVSPLSGTGNDMLTFTAEANAETTVQTAVVTISSDGVEDIKIVVVQKGSTTGIVSIESEKSIVIYPNPANDHIYIKGLSEITKLTVLRLNGQILMQQKVNDGVNVLVDFLPQGVYIIKLETSEKTVQKKLIKR